METKWKLLVKIEADNQVVNMDAWQELRAKALAVRPPLVVRQRVAVVA